MKNFIDAIYKGFLRFSLKNRPVVFDSPLKNTPTIGFLTPERKQLLEEKLGITIHHVELFEQALLHRSYLHLLPKGFFHSNERLEFLGDSVLGMVISDFLFRQNENLLEGDLTKIRSWLVNKHSLSICAKKLELDKFIMVSFATAKSIERGSESILSDAMEAIIGAIYLDSGFEQVHSFIITRLIPLLQEENILEDRNFKSILMETVQAQGKQPPIYEVLEESGPSHDKTFVIGVFVDQVLLAKGIGKSKKEAEQDAARNALNYLSLKENEVESGTTPI
ncbi:MAG: ribonuclease III [Candidatus Kapaibacteriales bacterium]